jgi:hypothetical protein
MGATMRPLAEAVDGVAVGSLVGTEVVDTPVVVVEGVATVVRVDDGVGVPVAVIRLLGIEVTDGVNVLLVKPSGTDGAAELGVSLPAIEELGAAGVTEGASELGVTDGAPGAIEGISELGATDGAAEGTEEASELGIAGGMLA